MAKVRYKEDYLLVHKYLCGDEDIGRKLYASIFDFVEATINKYTTGDILNCDDREDILEDTFMTSIEKLSTYNGNSKFSTFVIGIAKNKINEKLREKNKSIKDIDIDDIINYVDIINILNKNPLDIIVEKERIEAISKAIELLSDDHKQIIQLRLLNEMTPNQIMQITGKSIDSIDSMYRRAIKNLKKNFDKLYK